MEQKTDKEKKINTLPDNDKETFRLIISKLEELTGKSPGSKPLITESSITELEGIVVELLGVKDRHHKYLVRWLKQGYMDS